jgi:putative nucleotidyltransferase with HDIG domain
MQIQAAQTSPINNSYPHLQYLDIMVVDDESTICETLQLYLEHLGVRHVATAESGETALELLEQAHYDYVFVDLMMPGINGIEVLKKISEFDHPVSVIIMTGYPSMDIVIDAMHSGASDFLVKPFRFEDVRLSLERIQKVHHLMQKNWLLNQELEKKKEVEELNFQLQKRIRLQTILYNVIDSLSKISRSDNLYQYVVNKAVEYCNAQKACFLLHDQGNSHMLALAQQGLQYFGQGTKALIKDAPQGKKTIDFQFLSFHFGQSSNPLVPIDEVWRSHDLMAIPFNIRKEPFGLLLIGGKQGKTGFDKEDEFILKFLAEKTALNIENLALYDNLRHSLMATLMSLVSAIEAKDTYTQQHSSRVTKYALDIAKEMGCDHDDLQRINASAPLHDIGKIGISDNILNKPGQLTAEEFNFIKTHPLIGVNIVTPLGLDSDELAIIRNHHERWDGRGYPDGLSQKQIPRLARILGVADAFDAMNSNRAYRNALSLELCLKELKDNSGTQFDPEVVKAALSVLPRTLS